VIATVAPEAVRGGNRRDVAEHEIAFGIRTALGETMRK
jgi:hypothetical protein